MKNYLSLAKEIAMEAGAIMRQNFKLGMSKDWKKDNSPVTETDIAINRLVIERIKAAFPEHGVYGEEESSLTGKEEFVWVTDPVDGTIPFSHGIPVSVFSLGLTQNGKPLVGVVYDPYMDRLFTAVIGAGAFLNGEKISVNQKTDFTAALVNVHGWKQAKYKFFEVEKELSDKGALTIELASITYQGCLVACGEMTAAAFGFTKPEDCVALKVIIEEAGGKVTDLFGEEQRYDQPTNGVLMSNGKLHSELLGIIKKHI